MMMLTSQADDNVGHLKTRDLTSWDHWNCGDWHHGTGQYGTI